MKIVAHRGLPKAFTENTLLSLQRAVDAGADLVEFDIRLTADKTVVLIHDANLDRVWHHDQFVQQSNYNDLVEYNDSFEQTLATLEEALDVIGQTPCFIDIKSSDCVDVLPSKLNKYPQLDYRITSLDYSIVSRYKKQNPHVRIHLGDTSNPWRALLRAKRNKLNGVTLNHRWTVLPFVTLPAKWMGLEIFSYPVNKHYSKTEQLFLCRIIRRLYPYVLLGTDYTDLFSRKR